MKVSRFFVIFLISFFFTHNILASEMSPHFLDLSSCGQKCYWPSMESEEYVSVQEWSEVPSSAKAIGVVWFEERDVERISLRIKDSNFNDANPYPDPYIQYWFNKWPVEPPAMPTIEDPLDDPWQGKWLKPEWNIREYGQYKTVMFAPLMERENSRATSLPGVRYRRTMKMRLAF